MNGFVKILELGRVYMRMYARRSIYLIALSLTASIAMCASSPPQERLEQLLKQNKIASPYYLAHQRELALRGVNQPAVLFSKKTPVRFQSSSETTTRALAILIQYSDKPSKTAGIKFDSLLFGQTTSSLRKYYREVSYNQMDVVTINYPNPFNPTTTIRIALPRQSVVTIIIYDISGREVAVAAVHQSMGAGYHDVSINGSLLASGVYFYRIVAVGSNDQSFADTKKMLLVK